MDRKAWRAGDHEVAESDMIEQLNSKKSGIKPRSPTLQADSLQAEPQAKPKNTGVGSLPLLQQIFPTQESKRGLLQEVLP